MNFLSDVVQWFSAGEHWRGVDGIPHRTIEHVGMSVVSLLVAAAIALPVGLWLGHMRRGGAFAVNVANVGRALPSIAILILAAQVLGIGPKPTFVALVLLGVPPMLTNTYVGMVGVDAEAREAARGMGMTGGQMLRRVELPMAFPLVMAGIRTSAVQIVATATLAAVPAWGGLGRYIVDGIAQQDRVKIFAGAVLVAGLSVLTEVALGIVQRLGTPRGLRGTGDDAVVAVPGAGVAPETAAAV